MSEKRSDWHILHVLWYEAAGAWQIHRTTPLPEGLTADDVDLEYELVHPESCGFMCRRCGDHQSCAIQFDIMEVGWFDLLGQKHLDPGLYIAQHVLEIYRSWGGDADVNSWLEVEPYTENDERVAGLKLP